MAQPLNFKQELVGVFGYPVAENPTQAMIEPAFKEMGLDWRYLTVEVRPDQLADAVKGARAMNWRGFNCTIPHKIAVIPFLDRLNPAAEIIGAVNCVINRDGVLIGDNTDGKGFLQSLVTIRGIKGLNAVILGAGGAARAIATELALAHAARITIVNRSPEKAQSLVSLLNDKTSASAQFAKWEGEYQVPEEADVLINATPIGLFPNVNDRVPVRIESLRPKLIVCDVIPNPLETELLREARRQGCTVLDGLQMLVNQGVIGIRLWCEREPNPAIMRQSLQNVFQ